MENASNETWRAVVALLATDPIAPVNYQALLATARLAKLHPVALTGEMAPLNHLVTLQTADPAAFARFMALVEKKRAMLGLSPLEDVKEDRFDKQEYMKHFMAQKRQRTTQAADIENLVRGNRNPLRGIPRLEFMRVQAAKWNEELERRINAVRESGGGGRIPKEKLDALRTQFWAWVDSQLDTAEHEARGGR